MRVIISLFGEYRRYAQEAEFAMELPEVATPLTIVDRLRIPRSPSLWVLVDGKRASLDQELHQGSKVSFFQPVGGG
jgi:molybdopterin converting factor small subunit